MYMGSKFELTREAVEHYGEVYGDRVFTVTHVVDENSNHPAFDNALKGMKLYSADGLPYSVYDYEVKEVK